MVNITQIYKGFKFPKLIGMLVCIILAYIMFHTFTFQNFATNLGDSVNLGIFIAGMLFAFGFTAPFAVAFFVAVAPYTNLVDAAFIGGFGALIADLVIFEVIRFSLMDEFQRIRGYHLFRTFDKAYKRSVPFRLRTYITVVLAGIIIASPLPDEIGVTMLAGFTEIKRSTFAIISFLLNSLGIAIVLFLGSL
jgi:uncharacterized membrane protein YdjX (TVP38/TMEM64 family)